MTFEELDRHNKAVHRKITSFPNIENAASEFYYSCSGLEVFMSKHILIGAISSTITCIRKLENRCSGIYSDKCEYCNYFENFKNQNFENSVLRFLCKFKYKVFKYH